MLKIGDQLDYSDRMQGKPVEIHPDKFRPDYPSIAFGMALMGATNAQLAERFGVTTAEFNEWMVKYPELYRRVQLGREDIVAMAAESLAMRAIGFTYEAEKLWCQNGEVIRAKYKEYVPPDVSAATFLLTNRRPDVWAYRHTHEVGGVGGKPIQVENVSAREYLERMLTGLAERAEINREPRAPKVIDGRPVQGTDL